jgi:hypothetical protein
VIEQNPAYGTAQTFNLQDIYSSFLAVYALATHVLPLPAKSNLDAGVPQGSVMKILIRIMDVWKMIYGTP